MGSFVSRGVTKLESALEANEQELQTFSGLSAENAALRTESSMLRDFVEALGRERREAVMLTQNVWDLAAHSKKFRADAEMLRKQNMELAGEAREKVAQFLVKSALLKAVTEELVTVRAKLAVCRLGSKNSHWSA